MVNNFLYISWLILVTTATAFERERQCHSQFRCSYVYHVATIDSRKWKSTYEPEAAYVKFNQDLSCDSRCYTCESPERQNRQCYFYMRTLRCAKTA
jgi:hypothetical protein